ncbi:MAG: DNA cytosine methyltransferase [Chromatiaceae bacterium]|nr:DNA cytosine methyltransferase [Gammaproteobacteria bacterium]MCP5318107.1 DNA cytosine methyltransferase [Chromatiaceae bacterium]MCP5435989.1 DNA cytosine methyltransferase [Chromatiaceae bacterium]MCW5584848.1 DNA cytosine methyltransferase [Chromatiales bacterium]
MTGVTSIDLFCGAGGLSHGFTKEGLCVVAGIDVDPACKYPYESNNDAKFIERDVAGISGDELSVLFPTGAVKVLAGCAPCQPFSTYSQRYDSSRDGKWSLLNEFGRIAEELLPDALTMENVPALSKHGVFQGFVRRLRKVGYKVWADVVECADFGVPQTRRRLVLLASRHGEIAMIAPTHKQHRTVRDAIGRLRPIAAGEQAPRDPLHTASRLSSLNMARIRASIPGGSWRDWPKSLVADCHKAPSGRTYPSVYGRMEWNKPAPTMTTQCFGFGNGRFGHPEQNRAISLREAAILQSFPRNYAFVPPGKPVEFSVVGRLIGNAVPVDLGRAIARSLLNHFGDHGLTAS